MKLEKYQNLKNLVSILCCVFTFINDLVWDCDNTHYVSRWPTAQIHCL